MGKTDKRKKLGEKIRTMASGMFEVAEEMMRVSKSMGDDEEETIEHSEELRRAALIAFDWADVVGGTNG